jgi:hypothetical protein
VLGCLNEQCNHCGSHFWIEERTRGFLQRPHYSKCYASGKMILPPICTPPKYMSQPHFEGSVRSPLTLPKMGLESPPGLLKTQSSISGVKTPRLEVIFVPWKGLEV